MQNIKEDNFFKVTHCEKCGADLSKTGRTLSTFNLDVLCPACKKAERHHPLYEEAVRRNNEEYQKGNTTFEGILYKKED